MFEAVLDCIKSFDTIVIHRHSRPDGDALGSQIGMKNLITENFPEKTVYVVGDETKIYNFIPHSEMDDIPDTVYENALAILLDFATPPLASDDRYRLAKKTVRIDHHIYCETFTDVEVIDDSFESCCGMVTAFAVESGLKINKTAGEALYTGMITDSGRFRYDSTSSRTFTLASHLIETGFDTNELYRSLYADDLANRQLKARFTLKIQLSPKNVAYIYTTKEELKELGASEFSVSRGMVSAMSDIKGVDIWVNFTETDAGVLCELRSNRFNINPVAVKYGGGGHQKASGACVPDRETAFAMLADLDAIQGGANE
ncbi:MAG: bifunctional oligoribonuclease/PAP phosphatase NrnA [Clostridia bacterium]|nr:bifunctional oligoribonuclease/PAP phosphatase NrnA [Clostridia bacterium]MBR6777531.1 bifunctional oligoribonuclease/PAP phosphatase NrnA [Clostridia bacterium]